MAVQDQRTGGFTAYNTGKIENCLCCVPITSQGMTGSFCAENRGTLHNCCSRVKEGKKKETPAFCAKDGGTTGGCLQILCGADWDDQSVQSGGLRQVLEKDLTREPESWLKGWNLDSVWHWEADGDNPVLFLQNLAAETTPRSITEEINSREQLLEAVRAINEGRSGAETRYCLTKDLDLGGMTWTPMGDDTNTPFCGQFDGCGHTLENFVIRCRDHAQAGLFGSIGKEGLVCNLTVDCRLEGRGDHSAGLCGTNKGSIENCVVRMAGHEGRYSAGFAAQNSGRISRCSVFGSLRRVLPFPWWLPVLVLVLLLSLPPVILFSTANTGRVAEAFAPVILDPNAKPMVKEQAEVLPEPEELTDTSACFMMNAEMTVSTANYTGALGLRCPPWSSRGFVVTATVDGREVYQSGLISPGMGVDLVTLSGNLPAGQYEVTVQFDFYDMETNEKAAVNSTAPLALTVQ